MRAPWEVWRRRDFVWRVSVGMGDICEGTESFMDTGAARKQCRFVIVKYFIFVN